MAEQKPVIAQEAAKLDEFERAVYGRKGENRVAENDAATLLLLQCLRALGAGSHFAGYLQTDTAHYTRMASAIVALFCSPGFRLTQTGFDHLCGERAVLESVFKASVYNGSDFVFGLVPPETEGTTKFFMLFSMTSALNLDLEAAFRLEPQATVGLWLSLVSYGQTFDPVADARREHLLTLAPIFENVELPQELLNVLCNAYMHCSYAHGEDKHKIKATLHRILRRMMPWAAELPAIARPPRVKPVVVVVLDWWWSKHAMFRCYSQAILSLKRDFHVVGIAREAVTDEAARAVFDEFIAIKDDNLVLPDIAAQIRNAAPDILYFPSIGMSLVTIAMASLRLAPIQVMSYGHPATSMSTEIDYGILESDVCTPACFSETMIQLPPGSVKFVPYDRSVSVKHVPRQTDALKVAISAMQVKVSWPLVRALQEVQRRAKKKIEFHFFSAAKGVGLMSFTRQISLLLGNTYTYQMADYAEYMAWIAACDVCLFSFPFGGANSVIDCFQMGIPMLSMEGREPHAMTDASLMRRAGLPEHLIAKTEAEYVDALLMMEQDSYRAKVAEQVRAVDVEQFFRGDESEAFVNAFSRMYRNHGMECAA